MNIKVVKVSFGHLIFDRTHLSDAYVSDYPMVIDYILKINFTKHQTIKNDLIHF